MRLELKPGLAVRYKSRSQVARVVTEAWAADNVYCISCAEPSVDRSTANTRAIDFVCRHCRACYQLKASTRTNNSRVPDGAYSAMMEAVRSERCPNLLILRYAADWRVLGLFAVPSFCLTPSIVEQRPPLSKHARRAGWIGCNILLNRMPADSFLWLVSDGVASKAERVREQYSKLKTIRGLNLASRTWVLDVLRCVRQLQKSQFTLDDVYSFEHELSTLHPENRHIRPKIRQKLQVLREKGFIEFLGRGRYALRDTIA